MMFPDEEITALKNKAFEFECVDMTLTQASADNPITFKGRGFVKQTENDQIEFKIFATQVVETDPFKWLGRHQGQKAGRLYADSDFYNLQATDMKGQIWTASQIVPDCNWLMHEQQKPTVFGKIPVLSIEDEIPSVANQLEIFFFDEVNLPLFLATKKEIDGRASWKTDHAKFSAGGYEFVVRATDVSFAVTIQSDAPLNQYLAMRTEEALRYMLGMSVVGRAQILSAGGTRKVKLSSGRIEATGAKLKPPLHPATSKYYDFAWKLFTKYFEFVLATPHPYWHYCSYHLHNARQASVGSLDTWAVGVSVAVEGIANVLPDPGRCHARREAHRIIEEVLQLFDTSTIKEFKPRLGRFLEGMKRPRAEDRLLPLVNSGHVNGDHIKAWRYLRNAHVHPRERDLRNITLGDHQDLVDLVYKTTCLLYHLTFYLISYSGVYTDYSAHDWQAKEYPLKDAQEA